MKEIELLSPQQRGKLLHELFPNEIFPLLNYISSVCKDIEDNQDEHEKKWNDDLIPFNIWVYLATQTARIINQQKKTLIESSYLFAEQLCSTYNLPFVKELIIRYADLETTNDKFTLAVDLLYK